MRPFEDAMAFELTQLVRAGAPTRAFRITVRELLIARIERGPLGAREVSDAAEAAMRAACRLVREAGASDEMVEVVGRAAMEAVRGHGGESARWLDEAANTVSAVLDELDREHTQESSWRWLARRLHHW